MPAKSSTPKFHMPTVYLPKNENVFRCKVGYTLTKTGQRVRKEFRLGKDELIANKQAIVVAGKWLDLERRHKKTNSVFTEMFPSDPVPLPVWPAKAGFEDMLVEDAGAEEYLAIPPEDLPGDEVAAVSPTSLSVQTAATSFLERYQKKAGRDARAHASYWWYEREFRLGLVRGAIDPTLAVNRITLATVESYCDFWCDISARAAESKRKTFGWRSAHNRLDAFQFLLRDLKGRGAGFTYPERADVTFWDNKKSIAGAMTVIHVYDPETIKAVLRRGDDRLRLYVYCALNFGAYQADIGQQFYRRHTEVKGGIIELRGEAHLQWERHKLLRRQRAMKRENDRDKPVLLTHYIWPETLRLMNLFAAPEDNQFNLWLLNDRGEPLWRQEAHHRRPIDNISTAYNRAKKQAGVHLPYDQVRKLGATACESIGSIEIQEMYRGERRQGSSRVYVLQDFTGKLTPFLKAWGEQLRTQGVLY